MHSKSSTKMDGKEIFYTIFEIFIEFFNNFLDVYSIFWGIFQI